MRKPYLQATCKNKNTIEVYVSKDFTVQNVKTFRLYDFDRQKTELLPVGVSESRSAFIYTLHIDGFKFIPGHKYQIGTPNNFFIPLDISFLAKEPEFEEQYRYDGTLGASYTKNETSFAVFSPFSDLVMLLIKKKPTDKLESYVMNQDMEKGVFTYNLKGDYDGAEYRYEIRIFGEIYQVVDPYAFSLDSNSHHGLVIDPKKIEDIDTGFKNLPEFNDKEKAIIYECSVRDMTSLTSLPDKGTYSALAKEDIKSEDGMPVGIDYLSSLGVTHIQLQPVFDFQTVDEDNPADSYNWGYDPAFYFAPEGSYSSNPNKPYARVRELRNLVSSLHSKGLRVVFDVVYNHVFSQDFNSLSLLVPNYYFRFNSDGSLSNGTGCGNDVESRNYMVRKLIIDSLMHALDFYDVDGFRFDLMGITDVDTLKEAYKKLSAKKKNILFYGEGWDLGTNMPGDIKGSISNADKMPFCSFFNDRFRDVSKGKSDEGGIAIRGYLLGDTNYRDGFKHVILGSSVPLAFAPMFVTPDQSINFVECHDNFTLYDKIVAACPDDRPSEIIKRIKLCNAAVLLSRGIPFFHEGQEIGHSKDGDGNSYKSGDDVNGFDYHLLHKRRELYEFFKEAIALKKYFIVLSSAGHKKALKDITFENLPFGALKINYLFNGFTVFAIFNPSKTNFTYAFNDYVKLDFNETGDVTKSDIFIRMAIINGLSINVFHMKND